MLQVCAVFLVVFQIKAVAFLCTSRLAGLSLLHIRIAVNYFCLQEIISGHHYLNQNFFNFTINLEVALLLRQFLIDWLIDWLVLRCWLGGRKGMRACVRVCMYVFLVHMMQVVLSVLTCCWLDFALNQCAVQSYALIFMATVTVMCKWKLLAFACKFLVNAPKCF